MKEIRSFFEKYGGQSPFIERIADYVIFMQISVTVQSVAEIPEL
jgi:hypothetical protein